MRSESCVSSVARYDVVARASSVLSGARMLSCPLDLEKHGERAITHFLTPYAAGTRVVRGFANE